MNDQNSKKNLSSFFCPLPWFQVYVGNDGLVDPCCFADHKNDVCSGRGVRSQVFSEGMLALRQSMLDGVPPSICGRCVSEESRGIPSMRERALIKYQDLIAKNMEYCRQAQFRTDMIKKLDLRLGNRCNLRCQMCSPKSSKGLVDEWAKSPAKEMKDHAEMALSMKSWTKSNEYWQDLESYCSGELSINFAGGEPFLDKQHARFLTQLVEGGKSNEISLFYITNLSVMPDNLEYLSKNFRKLTIGVSLDGTSSVNSYIRYPLCWEDFWENVGRLDSMFSSHENVILYFATTIQSYNLLNIPELLMFLEGKKLQKFSSIPVPTFLYKPQFLDPRALPPKILNLAKSKFQKYLKESMNQNESLKAYSSFFQNLGESSHSNFDKNTFDEFVRYTNYFDEKRGKNFKSVQPEFVDLWSN